MTRCWVVPPETSMPPPPDLRVIRSGSRKSSCIKTRVVWMILSQACEMSNCIIIIFRIWGFVIHPVFVRLPTNLSAFGARNPSLIGHLASVDVKHQERKCTKSVLLFFPFPLLLNLLHLTIVMLLNCMHKVNLITRIYKSLIDMHAR